MGSGSAIAFMGVSSFIVGECNKDFDKFARTASQVYEIVTDSRNDCFYLRRAPRKAAIFWTSIKKYKTLLGDIAPVSANNFLDCKESSAGRKRIKVGT